MSQIKKLAKKNKKFSRFTKDYFNYLNNIFNKIDKKILDQLVGEFEMYIGETEQEFDKLQSTIHRFEERGFTTYCNRLLSETNSGHIPNNPCVELAFIKM